MNMRNEVKVETKIKTLSILVDCHHITRLSSNLISTESSQGILQGLEISPSILEGMLIKFSTLRIFKRT